MQIKTLGWVGAAVVIMLWNGLALSQGQVAGEGSQQQASVRTAAIFVKNRAQNVPDEKVAALEDLIVGNLSDKGFKVISREDVLNAVANFADAGPNRGDANLPGAKLDQILSNNTSALRLAQNLGADYILAASITTYGSDTIEYQEQDVHTLINESRMSVAYKMVDATAGGSLTGGVVEAVKKDRAQPGLTIRRDMINELLKDAAVKLADALGAKAQQGMIQQAARPSDELVEFNVTCSMGDLTVPEVMRTESGEYVVTANRYTVQAMNVTVAVDGITVGTTPGPFQAKPGLHKIRLSREGFKDWEQTINIRNGLNLNVAMQLGDEGMARWKEVAAFMQGLKTDAKLTDAEVKVLEGYAKMLSQSDFHFTTQNIILREHDHHEQQNQNTNINIVR